MLLAVCGCSWSCRDPKHPDIEFGKHLSNMLGYDYVNIAKPGCSNFGIALQVEYALEHYNPDLFIINATTVTRGEFKLLNSNRYDPTKGFDNVDHDHVVSEKFTHQTAPGFGKGYDPTIFVDSFGGVLDDSVDKSFEDHRLLQRYEKVFTKNSYDVFKKWFLYHFDADLERHKQQMILTYVLYKLQNKGKKFIFSPNTFDWAECYDLKSSVESSYAEQETQWDIPQQNMQRRGISEYLDVVDRIYGKWEDSPGPNYDHHLPEEAHIEYANTTFKQLKQYIL